MVFPKNLHPYVLDKSSRNIGRVNINIRTCRTDAVVASHLISAGSVCGTRVRRTLIHVTLTNGTREARDAQTSKDGDTVYARSVVLAWRARTIVKVDLAVLTSVPYKMNQQIGFVQSCISNTELPK